MQCLCEFMFLEYTSTSWQGLHDARKFMVAGHIVPKLWNPEDTY